MLMNMPYYYKWDLNEKYFLKDLEDTNKRYPELPTKEKVLEIYHGIVNQFENKVIESPDEFTEKAVFNLALGIYDKDEINKFRCGNAHFTKEQFMLACIPIESTLRTPLMKCEYKNDTNKYYKYIASGWILMDKEKRISHWYRDIIECMRITDNLDRFEFYELPSSWFVQYATYVGDIIDLERQGGGDFKKVMTFLKKEGCFSKYYNSKIFW